MAKTKVKMIDDSLPQEESQSKKSKVGSKKDSLKDVILGSEATPESKEVNDSGHQPEADRPLDEASMTDKEGQKVAEIASSPSAPRNDEVDKKEVSPEDKKETASKTKKAKTSKAAAKKTNKNTHGKKYQEAREKVELNKKYNLSEAIELAKETSYSKFPGTIEVHINTISSLRGLVTLPFVAGKKLKILAFGKGAADSGADLVGGDQKIAEIEKGKVDFDVLVTTPEWMPKLARVARFLGPRGLMPNPKSGTITDNLSKAVAEVQAGKTEYKTEPNGQVIHLGIGKTTQDSTEIAANIKTLFQTLGKSRVKKITLSPTMGPGIKIDSASL